MCSIASCNRNTPTELDSIFHSGSSCLIPDSKLQAKTKYYCLFQAVKTAAGTAGAIINIRFGTNGSTADTSRGTLTFSAQANGGADFVFEIVVTFRTVGSGTSAVIQTLGWNDIHYPGLATGALFEAEIATSGGFDSTVSNSIIGISVNGGASASWTIELVQSEIKNLLP